MIKLIATSETFTGEVHIIYGDDNILLCLDFQQAELNIQQRHYLKERTPIVYGEQFAGHFGNARLAFVQEGYEVSFDMFWNAYGKKINAKRCEAIWNKMSKGDRAKAYFGLFAYLRYLQEQSWRSKADPETYLKKQMWLTDWSKAA